MPTNSGSSPPMSDEGHLPVWWNLTEDYLLKMLRRVAAGEDPDMVYADEYASAERSVVKNADEGS